MAKALDFFDHLDKFGLVVGLCGIGMMVSLFYVLSFGREVYRGDINCQHVVYAENVQKPGSLVKRTNEMRIRSGQTKYIFYDFVDQTSIQSPDFDKDRLEKIIINIEGDSQKLISQEQYDETPYEQHTKSMFEKCNQLYNNLRHKIKNIIEDKYRGREENIPQ